MPEALVAERAVAEIRRMVETHQPIGTTRAGERRQEAGGLALVALALIVRDQLKNFLLRRQHPLQAKKNRSFVIDHLTRRTGISNK